MGCQWPIKRSILATFACTAQVATQDSIPENKFGGKTIHSLITSK
jgi:hypothetical protein